MSKKLSFILCLLYSGIIAVFSAALFILPHKSFSPTENRMLTQYPTPSEESLLDGSYAKSFADFCADQFPLRNSLLSLNSAYELGLGQLESGGVMYGQNGNLIKRLEYSDTSELEENLAAINAIGEFAKSNGTGYVFFCAPRAVDVLEDFCPAPFDGGSDRAWELIGRQNAFTVTELLKSKANDGEYVFYKTDHHWTALGAYYAYSALGALLGYEPYSLSDFTAEEVSGEFFGTSYSASLFAGASPDRITAMRYDGDIEISVNDMSTGKKLSLYDCSALDGSSKYDFFLGGNKAHLHIGNGDKPRLVIIKDSFANSLVPFLARHYDIDLIDPRYLREPLKNLLTRLYSDGAKPPLLILFNLDTLTGDIGLKKFD